jgi:uncharacterized protein
MSEGLPFLQMARKRPWPPRITAFTEPFWKALADGRLTTTCCDACELPTFPPKPYCPSCWSREMRWIPLSGRGRLYSRTVIHVVPAGFADEAPLHNGIVDLDEGLRVAARLIGDEPMPLDSVVQVVVLRYEDGPLFGFRASVS